MTRTYPYYPAWDAGKASPLILKAANLLQRRFPNSRNLGTYVHRDMRDKPGNLSVHATGYALDLAYRDEGQARQIWDTLVGNSLTLGLAECHWYTFGAFGAGYRCSRGEGKRGVRIYGSRAESAGVGGPWLHIELAGDLSPDEWETRFRAIPKP